MDDGDARVMSRFMYIYACMYVHVRMHAPRTDLDGEHGDVHVVLLDVGRLPPEGPVPGAAVEEHLAAQHA